MLQTVRVSRIMDTKISVNMLGEDKNFGREICLDLYSTNSSGYYAFINFSLSDYIPPNATIKKFVLNPKWIDAYSRLVKYTSETQYASINAEDIPVHIDLYTPVEPWDEYTLTYNNAPKYDLLKEDFLVFTKNDAPSEIDLTAFLDKIKYGIVFIINGKSQIDFNNNTNYNKNKNIFPYYVWGAYTYISMTTNENKEPLYGTVTYSTDRPQQPKITSPSNSDVINKADNSAVKIEWESVGQAGFELQYSQDNYMWDSIKQDSTNKFYNFNLNNIQGNLYMKLRIKDNDGIYSDFSTPLFIQIGERPATPTVVVLGANTSTPKVMWDTIEGQYGYEVEIYKDAELVEDSGNVNGDINSYNVKARLANNTIYKVKVKIRNEYGIWSLYGEKDITIVFKMPSKPIVTTYIDIIRGSIKLDIDNPNPQENEEQAVYNEVYRREKGAANWLRIATNITNSFVDYTPVHNMFYEYFVRAIGENGYKDSDIINSKVKIKNSQIAIVGDYDNWVELAYNPERQRTQGYKGVLLEFSGRKDPVPEFKQNYSKNIKLSFTIKDEKELNKLQNIIDSMKTLLYRDNKKQCVFGIVPEGLQIKETQIGWWDVEFNFVKTFYQEEA